MSNKIQVVRRPPKRVGNSDCRAYWIKPHYVEARKDMMDQYNYESLVIFGEKLDQSF